MNLILHIGTAKTGTTSIQAFLKKNIDQLTKNGVYIPQTPMVGPGNHRWIPLFANNASSIQGKKNIAQLFKNNENRNEKISYKKDQFLNECQNAANTCNTLILTSEHLQTQLRSAEEIQRLRNLVENFSDKIRIILYIRDPLKTAVSQLSTSIKSGNTPIGLPSPNQTQVENLLNHDQTIKRWQECFPDAEFVVRRFERSFLTKGDVVIDFCSQVLGDFREEEYEFTKPTNETLTLTGMSLLRKLNLQFPRFVDKKFNLMRGQIVQFVMDNTNDQPRFLPCRDEFDVYKNHFRESCEKVRSQYFPLEKSLFTDQEEFAEKKINLNEVEIDSLVYEKLVTSLWSQKRELELRLRSFRKTA